MFSIVYFSFTASLYQSHGEFPSSGYKELDRGLLLDVGFNSIRSVSEASTFNLNGRFKNTFSLTV